MQPAALAFALWVGIDVSYGTEGLYGLPEWEQVRRVVHDGERTLAALRVERNRDREDPAWWQEAADDFDAQLVPWRWLYMAYTPDEWGDWLPDSHRNYVRWARERIGTGTLREPVPRATRLWAPWLRF